jgi:glucosyl-3-phosphoglycerate phosphatase
MDIYLVRHGQSIYNSEDRIQGQADPSLSPLGQKQAEATARWFADKSIEAIWSSPLARASETVQFIAQTAQIEIQFDDRLMEVDCGDFCNRIRTEILQEYPGSIPRWRSGDKTFRFPGGESRLELIERGKAVFEDIYKKSTQMGYLNVVIVSHGGLLLAGMKAVLGIESEEPPHSILNAAICRLTYNDEGRPRLAELDLIDHLDSLNSGVNW